MKKLYDAGSVVEAHMIRDLLRQEGISARIDGEYLQGALGELPAAGLVSLVVEDEDYPAARALVERWDAQQPAQSPSRPPPAKGRGAALFLVGLAIGIGCTAGFLRAPVVTNDIDHNGDGKVDDTWLLSPNGTILRNEVDRNFDGKIDLVTHFSAGVVKSTSSDDDFNGSFESEVFFKNDLPEFGEVDTNGDTVVDQRTRFGHGVVLSIELIDPHTGHPRKISYLRLGKMTHAEIDADGNGTMDTRVGYDELEEVVSRERL